MEGLKQINIQDTKIVESKTKYAKQQDMKTWYRTIQDDEVKQKTVAVNKTNINLLLKDWFHLTTLI